MCLLFCRFECGQRSSFSRKDSAVSLDRCSNIGRADLQTFDSFFSFTPVLEVEVFVQQTMKTASSDEELAFKQKEKDAQMWLASVRMSRWQLIPLT